jgi:hypothetical protein
LVRARTLVLIFPPTIRQQSRLLSERHAPSWPSLDGLLECSPRNPVITGKTDQLVDVGIPVHRPLLRSLPCPVPGPPHLLRTRALRPPRGVTCPRPRLRSGAVSAGGHERVTPSVQLLGTQPFFRNGVRRKMLRKSMVCKLALPGARGSDARYASACAASFTHAFAIAKSAFFTSPGLTDWAICLHWRARLLQATGSATVTSLA